MSLDDPAHGLSRMLVVTLDPVGARHQLYALSAKVPVTRTEKGVEMDFGCCVVRVWLLGCKELGKTRAHERNQFHR